MEDPNALGRWNQMKGWFQCREKRKRGNMRQGVDAVRTGYSFEILKGGETWHDGKGVWKRSQRSPLRQPKSLACKK